MIRRILGAVAAMSVCLGLAPAAALQRVYVANITAGTVAVLDADRRTVLDVIPVGAEPDGLTVGPDGAAVYVANFGSNSVSVIDTATDSVVITVAAGAGPVGVAVSPNGAEVWVANKTAGTLSVIDAGAATVTATIPLGPHEGPNALAFTTDGRHVVVTDSSSNRVSLVDAATRQVTATLPVPGVPNRVVVGPGGRAFVTTFKGGRVVVIDLTAANVASEVTLPADDLTAAVLSPDGRTLYVASSFALFRIDTASLAVLGDAPLGRGTYGLAALSGGGPLIAANMPRSEVGFVDPRTIQPAAAALPDPLPFPTVPVFGGPFAIAVLPHRDHPALTGSIDAPVFDFKLDPHDSVPVRISAGDGTAALTAWTLTLRALDGVPGERVLASGNEALDRAAVATIAGSDLRAGAPYELRLSALGGGRTVVRRLRFSVPDRRFALVPLDAVRRDGFAAPFAMDAVGEQFVRWNAGRLSFDTYDATTGTADTVDPPLRLDAVLGLQLSRDGRRLVFMGSGALNGVQLLNLDNRLFSLLPYSPLWFDFDAAGRWLAGTGLVFARDRYQLLDTVAGDRLRISDVDHLQQDPPICRPFAGNRPRVTADGNLVVFATGLDFGFAEARGCNVFTYDRAAQQVRLVAVLGDTQLAEPSLDDAGRRMGAVLSSDVGSGYVDARATLVDLETGVLQDVLAERPDASYDAALVGDGSGVVVSSCADLDPSVGNADRNQELFLYDLAAATFRQITDTHAGHVGCQRRDGAPFAPLVSHDGRALSFATPAEAAGGPLRDWRNGLAFAAVRAVAIDPSDRPPELAAPEAVRVRVDEAADFSGSASDPDGDPIAYFAAVDDRAEFPPAAGLTWRAGMPTTFRFKWFVPEAADAGEHLVRIVAFDGRGGEAAREVRLAVCRLFVDDEAVAGVVTSIFDPLPAACGSADANGDGAVTAADLVHAVDMASAASAPH